MIVQQVGSLVRFHRISVIVAGLNFVFKRTIGECSEHLSGVWYWIFCYGLRNWAYDIKTGLHKFAKNLGAISKF